VRLDRSFVRKQLGKSPVHANRHDDELDTALGKLLYEEFILNVEKWFFLLYDSRQFAIFTIFVKQLVLKNFQFECLGMDLVSVCFETAKIACLIQINFARFSSR
jgi:hypothetical protein